MLCDPGTTMRVVEVPPERSAMVTLNATQTGRQRHDDEDHGRITTL
jgi:hypothetical protein